MANRHTNELEQALRSKSSRISPRKRLKEKIEDSFLITTSPHILFLPDAAIGGLLPKETVRSVIYEAIPLSDEFITDLVKFVRKEAKKIFCILVIIDNVESILRFYSKERSDAVLPIDELPLKDICPSISFKRFNSKQWQYLSPLLDGSFQIFPDASILPFKEDRRIPGAEGGYGEVHKVLIYANHQNLTDVTNSVDETIAVARKSYIRGEKDERLFSRERRCWKLLTILRHPHIIDFLGSYYYQENFHIICGLADMNLKEFMKQEKRLPGFETNEDFYRSILGLSSALRGIHYYEIDPTYGEYSAIGLHHDIKPQNILVKGGKLLWADFGTARVKIGCENSKTRHQNASVVYEAPESVIEGKCQQVGRSIDVWAFGCVLCEITSYMLFGKHGVEQLNKHRAHIPGSGGIDRTDSFHSGGKLKPEVRTWIGDLKKRAATTGENCMVRLIDCIGYMLVPQARRPNANEVHQKLSSIFEIFGLAKIRLHEGSRPARSLLGSAPVNGVEGFLPLLSELEPIPRDKKQLANIHYQLKGVAASNRAIGLLLEPEIPDTSLPAVHYAPPLSGNLSILKPPRVPDSEQISPGLRRRDNQTLESYVQWLKDEGTTPSIRSRSLNLRERRQDGRTPLQRAIIERNALMVQSLLELGANPDKTDKDGRTALHWAACVGDLQLINKLLSNGAVNISTRPDNYGSTPLHYAASCGHKQIVERLLDVTQDTVPDLKDHSNRTPLHLAAMNGLDVVVSCLLRNGAQAKLKDNDGLTPLHLASIRGYPLVIELLLNKKLKVDPNAKDTKERTSLFYAAEGGHESAVSLLLKDSSIKPDNADLFESTPLFVAVRNGHESVVRCLLDKNANPDTKDCMQRTAVHWAAVNGNETILKLLLARGAQPDPIDQQNHSPLHLAILKSHEKVSIRLLDARADPPRSNANWTTALHMASSNGLESVVKKIIHMGYLNSYTISAALKYAACNGHIRVVSRLLDVAGVDPNHSNSSKRTAVHLAADNGYIDVIKLLLLKGADFNQRDDKGRTALHWAARRGHELVLEHLINTYKADPNQKDKDMHTALHYTTANGHNSASYLLLIKGANPGLIDNTGRNAVHWAAIGGHEKVLKYLTKTHGAGSNIGPEEIPEVLQFSSAQNQDRMPRHQLGKPTVPTHPNKQGPIVSQQITDKGHKIPLRPLLPEVDISVHDSKGFTPLHLAAQGGHVSVVRLLKNMLKIKGATLDSLNTYGQTPLHLAAIGGHQKVVECLLAPPPKIYPKILDLAKKTALCLAYINDHEPVVRTLLECQYVDLSDQNTTTKLLHWAAKNGHCSIVKRLRELKVDLNVKDRQGRNALHLAAIWGHINVARALIPRPEYRSRVIVNVEDGNNLRATQHAAKNQHEPVLRFLLGERHGRLDAADATAALFWAAKKGYYELISLLLSVPGVDPNSRNQKGQTPLHLAAIEGHKNAVSCLLGIRSPDMKGGWGPSREAADQKVLDGNGDTALNLAFTNNRISVVEFLLKTSKLTAFYGDYKGLREWALANHCREVVAQLKRLQIYIFKLICRDREGTRYIKGEIHSGGSVMTGIYAHGLADLASGEILRLHSFSYDLREERDLLIYLHESSDGKIYAGGFQDASPKKSGGPSDTNSKAHSKVAILPVTNYPTSRRILQKENFNSVWSSSNNGCFKTNTHNPPSHTWLLQISFSKKTSIGIQPRTWLPEEVMSHEIYLPRSSMLSDSVSPQGSTHYTNIMMEDSEAFNIHMQLEHLPNKV